MNAYKQLLEDLEAKRDMAFMDAKDARVKAETLECAVIMLRNAIKQEEKEAAEQLLQPDYAG